MVGTDIGPDHIAGLDLDVLGGIAIDRRGVQIRTGTEDHIGHVSREALALPVSTLPLSLGGVFCSNAIKPVGGASAGIVVVGGGGSFAGFVAHCVQKRQNFQVSRTGAFGHTQLFSQCGQNGVLLISDILIPIGFAVSGDGLVIIVYKDFYIFVGISIRIVDGAFLGGVNIGDLDGLGHCGGLGGYSDPGKKGQNSYNCQENRKNLFCPTRHGGTTPYQNYHPAIF